MSQLTQNTALLIGGLVLLVVNLLIGFVQVQRGKARAGALNVLLAIVACVLVAVGFVRLSFQMDMPSERLPMLIGVTGGILIILASLILYGSERGKQGFEPRNSPGLLNTGAGVFVLVAALVIPFIPFQLAGTPLSAAVNSALGKGSSSGASASSLADQPTTAASPTPRIVLTATPTLTLTPSETPTPQPSLTLTLSETPITLFTPIAYVSTYALVTPTNCTVTASVLTYLRGDQSEKMTSIETILPGTLLPVTGRTGTRQWWRVIDSDSGAPIEGWVRADSVTADSSCTWDSVPVVGPTETPTRAPKTTQVTGTPAPCTIITTSSASLRSDPSRQQPPIAQIPGQTAFNPVSQTADRIWWEVVYNGDNGWISAGSVLASSSCTTVPTITPTP